MLSDNPTFITGDFNMGVGSGGYNVMTAYFTDANAVTVNDRRPTYNGYGKGDEHIDFCFTDNKIKAKNFKIIDARLDGKYASDHNGIYIEMEM